MEKTYFITRADDCGSSMSANRAIRSVVQAGFVKNVSVMAPGPCVVDAAKMMASRKDICFGMHATINAEWDNIKWKPLTPLGKESGLVDENGFFLSNPSLFKKTKPAVETIMQEIEAQLERLYALGFNIRYIDSHMLPEMYVDGLDEAMREFAQKKGLLDHMCYYSLPPGFGEILADPMKILQYIGDLPAGQYFLVIHPSLDTEEMRKTGNAAVSGELVAKSRAKETAVFSDKELCAHLHLLDCEGIRYDGARPMKRLTIDELKVVIQQN